MPEVPLLIARRDANLEARVDALQPLIYGGRRRGPVGPGHVRAASGIRVWGRRLVVIQDDVNILAIQEDGRDFRSLLIPTGQDQGGTSGVAGEIKSSKMDLEACLVLPDGRLVGFGSGSSPKRERIVVAGPSGGIMVREGRDLYALLRETTAFSGSELNIEGATAVDGGIRLFQRGNGAPTARLKPVNATGDLPLDLFLDWLDRSGTAPHIANVRQYDLGEVAGVRYGFTDAAMMPDGRMAFIACAEDSPDTVQDGAIIGAGFGLIDHEEVRITEILAETGRPTSLKFEGIEWLEDGSENTFLVVADLDDPGVPAQLGRLRVTGLSS
jgi:hypothetical protein